jgi:hypothetical protein
MQQHQQRPATSGAQLDLVRRYARILRSAPAEAGRVASVVAGPARPSPLAATVSAPRRPSA